MLQGKVNAAIKLLDRVNVGSVLPLCTDTVQKLKLKHPNGSEAKQSALLTGEVPFCDPAMFNNLDENRIRQAALRTRGSCGPSGMDANGWRHILASKSFGKAGKELCTAVADFAKILCRRDIVVQPECSSSLEAYTACRLIPLDKKPGVRPIGVGEILRRIVGKAIVSVVKPEIMESAGSLQLCAGLPGGCEAAVHAMSSIFQEEDTDAILLVDAENAFNSLNRNVLLHNIQYICPPVSTYVRNCYKIPSRLFITGGSEIQSKEGTTQGDPLAMPVYAIGITPLLATLKREVPTVKEAAFADDLSGGDKLLELRTWWNALELNGPDLGYYPNGGKSWLVLKSEEKRKEAEDLFQGTGIKITVQGHKYLGGHLGNQVGASQYAMDLVENWSNQLRALSVIAKSQPQAAYACFVSGFRHKITYFMRTFPELHHHLDSLDTVIDSQFIPVITEGHLCSEDERLLLSLPWRMGGRYVYSSLLAHCTVRICKFEEGYSTARCQCYSARI